MSTYSAHKYMSCRGMLSWPHLTTPDVSGVTRKTIISMVDGLKTFPACRVRNISLAEMYAADEVFTTGQRAT